MTGLSLEAFKSGCMLVIISSQLRPSCIKRHAIAWHWRVFASHFEFSGSSSRIQDHYAVKPQLHHVCQVLILTPSPQVAVTQPGCRSNIHSEGTLGGGWGDFLTSGAHPAAWLARSRGGSYGCSCLQASQVFPSVESPHLTADIAKTEDSRPLDFAPVSDAEMVLFTTKLGMLHQGTQVPSCKQPTCTGPCVPCL